MQWYIACFKKYAVFEGRASRQEYWMFVLFNAIFSLATLGLDHMFGTLVGEGSEVGVFNTLYSLAVILPGLGVGVRRLHDIGKSGWYLFVTMIPIAGFIWFIVMMTKEGDRDENDYGGPTNKSNINNNNHNEPFLPPDSQQQPDNTQKKEKKFGGLNDQLFS